MPVKKILLGALSIAWIRRREYLSALALPTLLFAVTWALAAAFTSNVSAYAALVILPFYAVAFTLFAVTCHRFILANDSELTARKRITLGRRELHFFGWMVTTYLIVGVVKVAMTTLLMTAHGVSEGAANGPPYWLEQLASISAYERHLGSVLASLIPIVSRRRSRPMRKHASIFSALLRGLVRPRT